MVKLLGSVGAVAGGLAVGKEGPFVHAGACLGALLSQVRQGLQHESSMCAAYQTGWHASLQNISV